ncbi:AraC family transcriptional regulator [Bradyrhizobium sp. BR 10289]|uniref:helix-turn-helix domain-containing protein n=1 Tax=Bradyrhizobium sp. BR 10289 TaxID=2749993 RepID=UPI001C653012|nr:AraC family transcriptional regulator [Bradyrhizobium sp. BR 10289]MBW7974011.1 helix-turn-helix transcriptional regulator [Bradyrhizobium sp. BR 10289]
MTKFGQFIGTRSDGGPPRTFRTQSAPGESGVSVLRTRLNGDTHFHATAQQHLISFQLSPYLRLRCRMAGRQLEHDPVRGTLAICPAGLDCAVKTVAPADMLIIAVKPEQLALAAAEDYEPEMELPECFSGYDRRLLDAAQLLASESAQGYPNGPLFWHDVASRFFGCLSFGHMSKPGRMSRGRLSRPTLLKIREYVLANLAEPIEVDELAALVGRSPFHFSRVFARSIGMTPYRYVVHLRLQEALRQLREGRMRLAEIAAETGFADQSHLSRWVRRVHGVSPSEIH